MGRWSLFLYPFSPKVLTRSARARLSQRIPLLSDLEVSKFRPCKAKAALVEAKKTAAEKTSTGLSLRTGFVRPFPENVDFSRKYGLRPGIHASHILKSRRAFPQSVSFSSVCDPFDEMGDREWHSRDGRFHRVFGFAKTSAVRGDKEDVSIAHCSALKIGALAHLPISTSLLMAYSRAADLSALRAFFDEIPDKDVITWNAMITSLADNQWFVQALDLFAKMMQGGSGFDSTSLLIVSSIFTRTNQLIQGRIVHSLSVKSGMLSDYSLCNALMDMYAKCGDLSSSESIFVGIGRRDDIAWNSILSGCLHNNNPIGCLLYFKERALYEEMGDSISLSCAISAAASLGELSCGSNLHGLAIKVGYDQCPRISVANSLIAFYFQCGHCEDAEAIFRGAMALYDIVSWNTMIDGYASNGMILEAFDLLHEMQLTAPVQPDSVTLLTLISVCADAMLLIEGKTLHGYVTRRGMGLDPRVTNSLMNMYLRCGAVRKAEILFDSTSERDVISWNTMICGYSQNDLSEKAQSSFKEMLLCCSGCSLPTLLAILPSCNSPEYLRFGESIHCLQLKLGFSHSVVALNSTMYMYVVSGDIRAACKLLTTCSVHEDLTCWNTFIAGCSKSGFFWEALEAFNRMREEHNVSFDSITLVNIFSACGNLELFLEGRLIHGLALKTPIGSDTRVCNALITMYGRCTDIASARLVFNTIGNSNLCSWNCLISALCQNKAAKEAVELFGRLAFEYDEITIVNILSACTQLGLMQLGTEIHSRVFRVGFHENSFISAALVDMYSNCGKLGVALQVFRNSPKKSIAAWNSMISAHGYHGDGKKALKLFEKMRESGTRATKTTFISLLSACSHAGLVKEGLWYYEHMEDKYGVEPVTEHHLCVVDMLGRSGKLFEAYELIMKMKTRPKPGIWGALLSSCNYHGNIEMGREVAELLFEMEPENSGYYIALSNMYTAAGGWVDAVKIRELIQEKGLRKPIGYSLLEMG
ncbi:LOW QUALITY PROTEIN: pentatricopeptide repeat-containing protein At4g19220, mitochondrial [Rhodamnia argentea]|uniref:LOW QUALITY PROTEIN: pentatricopeptide repeat-containing protein At4g19220, mitochondrial n=1 Tax=Rhodamnia argentea TaxID=178133 RepID=A0A8B8NBK2_9MYRT|nr:LOW QUALITY PROTEIN: pentatricopeptide repeat-containing protein At4g19220, mitochondrial [Rhodamnia argentea]